jgi:hypothetical protein
MMQDDEGSSGSNSSEENEVKPKTMTPRQKAAMAAKKAKLEASSPSPVKMEPESTKVSYATNHLLMRKLIRLLAAEGEGRGKAGANRGVDHAEQKGESGHTKSKRKLTDLRPPSPRYLYRHIHPSHHLCPVPPCDVDFLQSRAQPRKSANGRPSGDGGRSKPGRKGRGGKAKRPKDSDSSELSDAPE